MPMILMGSITKPSSNCKSNLYLHLWKNLLFKEVVFSLTLDEFIYSKYCLYKVNNYENKFYQHTTSPYYRGGDYSHLQAKGLLVA